MPPGWSCALFLSRRNAMRFHATISSGARAVICPVAAGTSIRIGVWLSLVERTVRDREVGGSNPPTPTIQRFYRLCFLLVIMISVFESGTSSRR